MVECSLALMCPSAMALSRVRFIGREHHSVHGVRNTGSIVITRSLYASMEMTILYHVPIARDPLLALHVIMSHSSRCSSAYRPDHLCILETDGEAILHINGKLTF